MTTIRTTEPIEAQLEKSQKLIETLNENCRNYRLKIDLLEKKLAKAETKAEHFDILLGAVKENEVVRGAWDKFMMTLRLAGYDGTN